MNKKHFKIKNIFLNVVATLFSAVAIISLSTIAVLNSVWIYGIMIDKYNLTKATSLTKEGLMKDYVGLINYLQNPFIDKLKFNNFVMSTNGEIHFIEVKRIFLALIIIGVIFVIGILIWSILKKIWKTNLIDFGLLKILNGATNILIGFFIFISTLYFIDFSWAFTMFHKVFFRNDYWIFDPAIDPVIKALPEELFMVMGGIILGIVVVTVIGIKFMYYRDGRVKVNVEVIENNKQITM